MPVLTIHSTPTRSKPSPSASARASMRARSTPAGDRARARHLHERRVAPLPRLGDRVAHRLARPPARRPRHPHHPDGWFYFREHVILLTVGVDAQGANHVLTLREGSTEKDRKS